MRKTGLLAPENDLGGKFRGSVRNAGDGLDPQVGLPPATLPGARAVSGWNGPQKQLLRDPGLAE
ncbi:hypothetical protein [Nioella sp.]|uniref:hypothetical protein n=1 Tax=Nioella sp. TaxID=1912091 RepID=UPI003A8BF04E